MSAPELPFDAPLDQAARDRIVGDLDANLFVEAGAGADRVRAIGQDGVLAAQGQAGERAAPRAAVGGIEQSGFGRGAPIGPDGGRIEVSARHQRSPFLSPRPPPRPGSRAAQPPGRPS